MVGSELARHGTWETGAAPVESGLAAASVSERREEEGDGGSPDSLKATERLSD